MVNRIFPSAFSHGLAWKPEGLEVMALGSGKQLVPDWGLSCCFCYGFCILAWGHSLYHVLVWSPLPMLMILLQAFCFSNIMPDSGEQEEVRLLLKLNLDLWVLLSLMQSHLLMHPVQPLLDFLPCCRRQGVLRKATKKHTSRNFCIVLYRHIYLELVYYFWHQELNSFVLWFC